MSYRVKVTGSIRHRLCALCGEFHEVANWPANHVQPLAAPMVIRDDMPPTMSMVDGSIHESKRGIRKTYEPSGNAEGKKFVEVGDDPNRMAPRKKPKADRKSISDSVAKGLARFNRGERSSDERKFK